MTRIHGKTHSVMQYDPKRKQGKTYCEKTVSQTRVVWTPDQDTDLDCDECRDEMAYWAKVTSEPKL